MTESKNSVVLVVGGTSGLGLGIARLLQSTHDVRVTGRHYTTEFPYHYFNMREFFVRVRARELVEANGRVDVLVLSAGFHQRGTIDQLHPDEIERMVLTNITGPALLVHELLRRQKSLPCLVAVTSTSEWMPRRDEPIYAATKRGLAGLAESLAEDSRIAKTLVVAPSKMDTPFWTREGHDPSGGLDPAWVAEQTVAQLNDDFYYRHMKILRDPARVEISVNKIARA